jgi:hypothetical protein
VQALAAFATDKLSIAAAVFAAITAFANTTIKEQLPITTIDYFSIE